MNAMASQITGVSIVYSTVGSGADQRKLQSQLLISVSNCTKLHKYTQTVFLLRNYWENNNHECPCIFVMLIIMHTCTGARVPWYRPQFFSSTHAYDWFSVSWDNFNKIGYPDIVETCTEITFRLVTSLFSPKNICAYLDLVSLWWIILHQS